MNMSGQYLSRHRCHDVAHLLQRWKKVARLAKLEVRTLFVTPLGFPVLFFETRRQEPGGLYISAGIHGDEAAPPTALLEWAEENIAQLKASNAVILPLLNPVGIQGNTRANEEMLDLNRHFHEDTHPLIEEWRKAVAGRKFSIGVMLHEDYDAQGLYAYQLGQKEGDIADRFLEAASKHIPRDMRRNIEGSKAIGGVIQRKRFPKNIPGLPEAIVLYRENAPVTLTFETPSEYGLETRVKAQKTIIEESFRFA